MYLSYGGCFALGLAVGAVLMFVSIVVVAMIKSGGKK